MAFPNAKEPSPTSSTGETVPPSLAVVDAVANAVDSGPTEIPPLHGYIDPEALDAVLEGTDVWIQFEYHGFQVSVDSDGYVDLREIEPE